MYAFQYDQRNEFDVRRSGRSDLPALKLDKSQHFFETCMIQEIGDWDGKWGVQFIRTHTTRTIRSQVFSPLSLTICRECGASILVQNTTVDTALLNGD